MQVLTGTRTRCLDEGEGGDDERDDRRQLTVDEPGVQAQEAVAAATVTLVLEAHAKQHYGEGNAPTWKWD